MWLNQYVMLGAIFLALNVNDDPSTHAGKFVAVESGEGGSSGTIRAYNSAAALAQATHDPTKFVIPLGKINEEGNAYEIDMRVIPHVSAWDAYVSAAETSSGGDDSSSTSGSESESESETSGGGGQ